MALSVWQIRVRRAFRRPSCSAMQLQTEDPQICVDECARKLSLARGDAIDRAYSKVSSLKHIRLADTL